MAFSQNLNFKILVHFSRSRWCESVKKWSVSLPLVAIHSGGPTESAAVVKEEKKVKKGQQAETRPNQQANIDSK